MCIGKSRSIQKIHIKNNIKMRDIFPLTKPKKLACIEEYTAECGGGKTTWLKGYIYKNNEGHIGLSGSCLDMIVGTIFCKNHFIEVKDNEFDKKYFETFEEGIPIDEPNFNLNISSNNK